jgi:hypothetical protein
VCNYILCERKTKNSQTKFFLKHNATTNFLKHNAHTTHTTHKHTKLKFFFFFFLVFAQDHITDRSNMNRCFQISPFFFLEKMTKLKLLGTFPLSLPHFLRFFQFNHFKTQRSENKGSAGFCTQILTLLFF